MTKDDSRIVKDPICGKDVDTLRARAVGIFGGVTYYFCSAECKAKYKDPRRTPRPARDEPAPTQPVATTEAPRKKADKPKADKSGRFDKIEPPAPVAASAGPEREAQARPRTMDFVAEPSSRDEQADEMTPLPVRRRFPLLALLILALLVAGGVVLFTLKHK